MILNPVGLCYRHGTIVTVAYDSPMSLTFMYSERRKTAMWHNPSHLSNYLNRKIQQLESTSSGSCQINMTSFDSKHWPMMQGGS